MPFTLRRSRFRRLVDRLDPNPDPAAEPVSAGFLLVFAAALVATAWTFLRFPVAPLQDFGMHVGLSAVVADRGRPGSIYDALYDPFDPLFANSLFYAIAGYGGRLVGVLAASRGLLVAYLVGLPIAMLYALRVFGRSPWPAVAAVGFAYNMNFVAGFANFVLAAPVLVLAIATYQRFLERPGVGRGALAAGFFALTFLTHAHLYLFLGLVTIGMTLAAIPGRRGEERPMRRLLEVLAGAVAVALPSLLLFGRWAHRVFMAPAGPGELGIGEGRNQAMMGASFPTTDQLLSGIFDANSRTTTSSREGILLAGTMLLLLTAVVLRRGRAPSRPPVLEATFLLSIVLYFVLPDAIAGQHVIASRQIGVALWFLPALLVPVHPRISRLAHSVVVLGLVAQTAGVLVLWNQQLEAFDRTEAYGLVEVLRAAPPRLRLYAPRPSPESAHFRWRPFWHVEPYYMAMGFGETPETPAIYAHNAVRYRLWVDYHRLGIVGPAVATAEPIWSYFDLVLFRRLRVDERVRRELESRAYLVKQVGDWQLWRNRRVPSAAAR